MPHFRHIGPAKIARAAPARRLLEGDRMFVTTTVALRLTERLDRALAAWAEAEGESVAALVERIVAEALHERRDKAKAAFEEARGALEGANAMLAKLLKKGPKAVLVPDDFAAGEPGRAETLRLLEQPPHDDYAIDLEAVRDALDKAATDYRRAETALTALEEAAPARAAAPDAPAASPAPPPALAGSPPAARVWSRVPPTPLPEPENAEADEAAEEPRLSIPRAAGEHPPARFDLSLDADDRPARGAPTFRRLFVKGGGNAA
jgi:hypothetical protein